MKKYNVAVVGVGAVGVEMIRVLMQRKFPLKELKVLARTSRDIEIDGKKYSVREVSGDEFKGIDIALFAGTEGEKGAAVTYAKDAIRHGAIVIDNGSDFRMDPKVPLVVPEVNPEDIKSHQGIIANPNCSTIQMVVALAPIHKAAKLKRIIVSTYQAVSGAGRKAIDELREQTRLFLESGIIGEPAIFNKRIAFNLIPQISKFEEMNYTTEEWKMVRETHKILHEKELPITATTVRVPVLNCHSESIYVETEKRLPINEVRDILRKSPGIVVYDEPGDGKPNPYPMPIDADGRDEVFVGRLREDPFVKNGLSMWVVADNLRKGAALNAIQIAEYLIEH